jgi:hypothetical protein
MRERQSQEFVDRVVRFRAEPREEAFAASLRPEDLREEIERRPSRRARAPGVETPHRFGVPELGGPGKRVIERSLALRRQREQIFVIEPDQRRFQHSGEREIILGQQRRPRRRDQIHHGHMFAELEPVGTGRRNVALFQRADHCFEEGVALADQNEKIARAHRA